MFDVPDEAAMFDAPDVRVPAPSAPGSDSSTDAAESRSLPKRQADHAKVLRALASVYPHPVSRDWLHSATSIPVSTLCAILGDGELRGLYIEMLPRRCTSSAKPTLHVDGYRLNEAGLAKFGRKKE